MVERSDDAAGKENDRREQHGARGAANLEELEARKEEGDDYGGEDFKESLDPEVNHPPAPVFGGDQMAALAIHQSSGIEHGDGDAGDEEQRKQGAVFAIALECRFEGADHEHQPEHQADEEQDLPQPSQV